MSNFWPRGSSGTAAGSDFPAPTPGRLADRNDALNDDWPPTDPRGDSFNFYTHPSRTSIFSSADFLLDATNTAAELSRSTAAPTAMDDMDTVLTANSWRPSGSLPSFSRAFDMFMPVEDTDSVSKDPEDKFFVPTYLESSTYMHRLRDAHRAKLIARKEAKRTSAVTSSPNGMHLRSTSLPTGSHRGMSHLVIERPTKDEEEDVLLPLPTQWSRDDVAAGLDIQPDGLGLKFPDSKSHHEREHEACAVRTDHHIPPQCGIYYFEVQILAGKRDEYVVFL